MTKINEIIENNLAAIAKKEMESEDYIEGIEEITLKLIKEILNGNTVTSSDIEDNIDKIVSKKVK